MFIFVHTQEGALWMRSTKSIPFCAVAFLAAGFVDCSAQPGSQRLLDTAVVANGVLPGYFTASGEHIIRMQYGPALEMHRYAQDGTALWWHRYSAEGIAWNTSVVASDGAEGAVVLGNATVEDRDGPEPRLTVMHMAVDGVGAVQQSAYLELGLDQSLAPEFQPESRLVPASDGAMYLVVSASDIGHPQLLIVKRSAAGALLWARGLGDVELGGASPWGDPATLVCADRAGGLYLARRDLGSTSLLAARIDADGTLLWMQRFEDPDNYVVESFDIASSPDGGLLVLGRMIGTGLPSGGTLQRISPQGQQLAWERYQWDIGRRLFVLGDGSMAAVKVPRIYRLDGAGTVVGTRSFEDWVIDPHQYIFAMTNMEVAHGHLWMQGALRRILIQFNTQRVWPAFATHPVDTIVGCQWQGDESYGSTAVDVASLTQTALQGQVLQVLDDRLSDTPVEVVLTLPDRHDPIPFCDQVVGLNDVIVQPPTLTVLGNPVMRGSTIELSGGGPGLYTLCDAQGRMLWAFRTETTAERLTLPAAPTAAGPHFLRWTPKDGGPGIAVKVLVY